MEKRFKEIADNIAKFMPKKCYMAFLDDSGTILYSSLMAESEAAVKQLSRVFPVWSPGDYQLKKLPKSNLLIYKASPRIILAIESYEKEGVLIVAGKRIEENYMDLFRELEKELPAPQAKAISETVSEAPLKVAQGVSATEELEIAKSIPEEAYAEEIEGEKPREPVLAPPSQKGEAEVTVTVSFPVLVDKNILKKVKEPMAIAILQLCDGDHTVDDIAEELGISKARVMITTGDFGAKGALKYVSGFRKIKR
ncbi:MAG: hypothetical protein Q6366_005660 [Candidatus Freyarchaeota archaeon]